MKLLQPKLYIIQIDGLASEIVMLSTKGPRTEWICQSQYADVRLAFDRHHSCYSSLCVEVIRRMN